MFLIGVCMLVSVSMFGQTKSDTLEIAATAPSTVTVCGYNVQFSAEIKNISLVKVDSLYYKPNMPLGMVYQSGSITNMSEHDVTVSHQPIFFLDSLNSNDSVTVTFKAHAICAIIPNISDPSQTVKNSTRVDFEIGANNYYNVALADPDYDVLWPDISIKTVDPNPYTGIYGDTFIRKITIINSGFGKLYGGFTLIDDHNSLIIIDSAM